MIKKKYRTTPLFEPGDRPPLEIKPAAKPAKFRTLQIAREFFKTLWRTRFGRADEYAKGAAWRVFFETLGGLWVKVGQLLAMRTDLYDIGFTRELSKLHYRMSCFPYSDVIRILEENLGKNISLVFSEFEETPIAAASIAQVHKAKLLHNGKIVAVKIQRPYAQEFFKLDMKIIRTLFNFFKRFEAFSHVLLDDMFWELESMLTEEIDFRYEAINLKEAKKRFKKYGIYVPVVYKKFSTDKVVVMEYVEGVTMSEYIAAKRQDPARLDSWLKRNKIKPKKVGSFLLRNVWRQVLEDNYFHGDLQPGNIMLLAKNRIALIDLGTVGTTDEETLSHYRQELVAIGKKYYLKAADFTIITSPDIPLENHSKIRQSIVRGLRGALMKASLTDVDIEHKTTVHNASNEMTKELAKYKVAPNWSLLRLIRTFLTIDPSVVNLNPTIDLGREWTKYYKDARWRMLKQRVVSLIEMPAQIADSFSMFMKNQRKQIVEFKARVSKGILIASYSLSLLKWLFTAAIFLFIWAFLYQHFYIVDSFHKNGGNVYTHLVELLPHLSRINWLILIIFSILFVRKFAGLIRLVKQPVKEM